MKPRRALSPAETRHFLEKGYVFLRNCFTEETAAPWIAGAYERLGYDPRDPKTWKEAKCALKGMRSEALSALAPRALEAICELVGGEDRLLGGRQTQSWSDSFIIQFPRGGAEIPLPDMDWHLDAEPPFFLDHHMGLATYVLWSDLKPKGGGTFIVPDSIGHVARYLARHPEGIRREDLETRRLFESCGEFVELTGKTGDVVLVHPFMIHSESPNIAGEPRFFTARVVELRERLNLNRENKGEFSLVETAILNALGVARLDFKRK